MNQFPRTETATVTRSQHATALKSRSHRHGILGARIKHKRQAQLYASNDPIQGLPEPSSRNNSNNAEVPRDEAPQLRPPPAFLPRMFHTAWREAMEEAHRSSTSAPQSIEQKIQQVKAEVQTLARGGSGTDSRARDSRALNSSSSAQASSPSPFSPSSSSSSSSLSSSSSSPAPPPSFAAEGAVAGMRRDGARRAASRPISRWPWISWTMVGWTGILFWKQWQPLVPFLLSATQHPGEWAARAAAFCLIVPDTPAAANWQMNVLDFVSGNWGCALPAGFLHSGLIPTLVFTMGLLEVSTLLEGAFGPAVLSLQASASALGAAALQTLLLPTAHTISGPAVVCGLYAGLAVHIARTRQLAQLAAAQAGDTYLESDEGDGDADSLQARLFGSKGGSISTKTGYACGVSAMLLGLYQPQLGIWAILGGVLGGVLAAAMMPWVMAGLQSMLFLTLVLVHRVWGFSRALPQLLVTSIIGFGRAVYLFVLELIKTVRQV